MSSRISAGGRNTRGPPSSGSRKPWPSGWPSMRPASRAMRFATSRAPAPFCTTSPARPSAVSAASRALRPPPLISQRPASSAPVSGAPACQVFPQVAGEGEARLPIAHEGELGLVGGALRIQHFEVRRVARLVALVRKLQRAARRLQALEQVGLRGAGLLQVHQRIGYLAERRLDRSLIGRQRLPAPRFGLLDRGFAPSGVEERQRKREAERPDAGAAREQVRERGAL